MTALTLVLCLMALTLGVCVGFVLAAVLAMGAGGER